MVSMKRAALFLAAALVLAGCTVVQNGTDDEEPKRLQVSGPSCTVNGEPCRSVDITRYSSPQVSIEIANYGKSEVDLRLGGEGRGVMVSDCNLYNIKEFDAVRESRVEVENVAGEERVDLPPDSRLSLKWELELADVDVSRLGYTCPLDFAVEFNQTLNTTRQVQVKEDRTVEDASALDSFTTAIWPVRLRIDTSERVLQDRSFVARAYLSNRGPGEVKMIGHSAVDHAIDLRFEGDEGDDYRKLQGSKGDRCSVKGEVAMYGSGERRGESFREVCQFIPRDVSGFGGSQVFEMTAETEYGYRMDLSEVRISLVPVEGG